MRRSSAGPSGDFEWLRGAGGIAFSQRESPSFTADDKIQILKALPARRVTECC